TSESSTWPAGPGNWKVGCLLDGLIFRLSARTLALKCCGERRARMRTRKRFLYRLRLPTFPFLTDHSTTPFVPTAFIIFLRQSRHCRKCIDSFVLMEPSCLSIGAM